MVGRTHGMELLYRPRQQVAMAGQKQNKEQHMNIAKDRDREIKNISAKLPYI